MHLRRLLPCTVLLVLVLASCGQKPGVHVDSFVGAGGQQGGTGTGSGGIGSGGTGSGGTGSGGTGSGGTVPTAGPTGGSGGGPSGPGTRTGIDEGGAKEIRIGVHAPLTGAAPISPEAFRAGAPVYWKSHTVNGRKVTVYVEDDKYRPTDAVTACNKMAVRDKVFLIVGVAGGDQIKACADYANKAHIPYLSAGVQEARLKDFGTYSALTMSYPDQMPLLAQYIKSLGDSADKYGAPAQTGVPKDGKIKVMFVRPDSNNFDDSEDALKAAISGLGSKYSMITELVDKEGTTTDADDATGHAVSNGIDIIVPITAPAFSAVLLAARTGAQSYFPLYAGVGITNNVNQAIGRACDRNQWQDAMFLSPWPGWSDRLQFQVGKDFDAAMNADSAARGYNTKVNGGDILMAIYGIMADVDRILTAAGPNLSRESVVAMMDSFSGKSGFFPDLQFAPGNPFGAKNVHALVGDCANKEFRESTKFFGLRSSFA